MIAKVIVWDETRMRAIQKMKRALSDTVIFGVRTNIPLLQKILSHSEFLSGKMTTRFFETHFAQALPAPEFSESERKMIGQLASRIREAGPSGAADTNGGTEVNPWAFTWGRA
jgi:3-methylcrotonyl-CoA carboxylase alpha subunit